MNLLDIAKVQPCITSLDITARNEGRFLHRWLIGERASRYIPDSMRWDVRSGKISLHPMNINWHDTAKGNGQPEMGWGLNPDGIPDELLYAEITNLGMQCRDGISYLVTVTVEMNPLTAEMVIATFKEE